jgi:putative DNA primase/helicase
MLLRLSPIQDNIGFHFYGGSSSGKTTALRLACSIYGKQKDQLLRWHTTTNGLEGLAVQRNDTLLALDEISQGDAKQAFAAIYMIGNGTGKGRANIDGSARRHADFRTTTLSSGEVSTQQFLQEGNRRSMAGQEVRLINIPQPQLNDAEKELRGKLAVALNQIVNDYYGSASEVFLERATAWIQTKGKDDVVKFLQGNVSRCVQSFNLSENADGQVRRGAQAFALVAVTGELATKWGLTGWDEGVATKAAYACFQSWLQYRDGEESSESIAILNHIRGMIERHGESRFSCSGSSAPIKDRLGYKVNDEFRIFPEQFKKEFCLGFDPKVVKETLFQKGWLIKGLEKNGYTSCQRDPGTGKSSRFYIIDGCKVLGG